MKIETTPIRINASSEVIYTFLMDTNNFKLIFPQEKVSEWESTLESCSMKVKNIGVLGLKRVSSKTNSLICCESFGKTPFKYTFKIYLDEIEGKCSTKIVFEGEVNHFMKMMVEKPLSGFINNLNIELAKIHS